MKWKHVIISWGLEDMHKDIWILRKDYRMHWNVMRIQGGGGNQWMYQSIWMLQDLIFIFIFLLEISQQYITDEHNKFQKQDQPDNQD